MPNIKQWSEIAGNYSDSLLLGNGASMAIDRRFSYRSLKEVAAAKGLITPNLQSVFDYLKTEDFELVMAMIWHANNVNMALGLPESLTTRAYEEVKQALAGAVRGEHVPPVEVRPYVRAIGTYMQRFKTVFSLNYDLIVYWAIMEMNKKLGTWFKDCFDGDGLFRDDWKDLRKPYGGAQGATLVFYPHGNLALTSSLTGRESKICIRYTGDDLLAAVFDAWETRDQFPLFVSEGTSQQKSLAISRSRYLTMVYRDAMDEMGKSCAIYGWSLNENDDHIVRRTCRTQVKRLAVSIFNGNKNAQVDCERIQFKVGQLSEGKVEVEFFCSESEDCWTNTNIEEPGTSGAVA